MAGKELAPTRPREAKDVLDVRRRGGERAADGRIERSAHRGGEQDSGDARRDLRSGGRGCPRAASDPLRGEAVARAAPSRASSLRASRRPHRWRRAGRQSGRDLSSLGLNQPHGHDISQPLRQGQPWRKGGFAHGSEALGFSRGKPGRGHERPQRAASTSPVRSVGRQRRRAPRSAANTDSTTTRYISCR